jgi:hypothetical protein
MVLGHRGETHGYEEECFSPSWRKTYKWARGERKAYKVRYNRRMRRTYAVGMRSDA